MKFSGIVVALLILTGQIVSAGPLLENSGVALSGTVDYYSSYLWRGQALDKDPVVQPGFTVGYMGFSAGFWSSMGVSDKDSAGGSNEVDMTVSYGRSFGNIGLSVGHISYEFPGTAYAGTKEVFAGASVNGLPFSLGVTYYSDYDSADGVSGSFSLLSLGKEVGKLSGYPVNMSLSYGIYGDYGAFKNGSVATVGFGSSMALTEKLSLTPSVSYVSTSGDMADEAIGNQKGGIYGGFSLGF